MLLAALWLLLYSLSQIPAAAEYVFARGITRFISFLVNRVTNFIPVSFFEWIAVCLCVFLPALLVALIVLFCKRQRRRARKHLYRLGVAALAIAMSFTVLYGAEYNRYPLNTLLKLEEPALTEENLYKAAEFYIDRLNRASAELERDGNGNVVPPMTFFELSDALDAEFAKLSDGYLSGFRVRPKRVALSVPMSYLGITGIYFPFTAEANVNMNTLPYERPVVVAHEMSHAKGIAHENEANFLAYYLCITSGNPYLEYSGLMEAAVNLLYTQEEDAFRKLQERMLPEIRREISNSNAHYRQYDTFLDTVSNFFNNLFLKSNGVAEGVRSYGQTTQSLVALYETLR